jgi:hypothetical protein
MIVNQNLRDKLIIDLFLLIVLDLQKEYIHNALNNYLINEFTFVFENSKFAYI